MKFQDSSLVSYWIEGGVREMFPAILISMPVWFVWCCYWISGVWTLRIYSGFGTVENFCPPFLLIFYFFLNKMVVETIQIGCVSCVLLSSDKLENRMDFFFFFIQMLSVFFPIPRLWFTFQVLKILKFRTLFTGVSAVKPGPLCWVHLFIVLTCI